MHDELEGDEFLLDEEGDTDEVSESEEEAEEEAAPGVTEDEETT